jgi:hypothetical protein
MIAVRQASTADIAPVARDMRRMDRVECAAFGRSPEQALQLGLLGGRETWALTLGDGAPVGLVGVVTVDAICGVGKPWLLCTDALMRERRAWAVLGPQIMDGLQRGHRVLENLVHQRNRASINWLRRLGCAVGDDVHPVGGEPFVRFIRCAHP